MLWFMVGCCHWLLTLYFYHIQETGHVLWSELTEPSLTFALSKWQSFCCGVKIFVCFFSDWTDEAVSSHNILKLIYHGRFLHGNVSLGGWCTCQGWNP